MNAGVSQMHRAAAVSISLRSGHAHTRYKADGFAILKVAGREERDGAATGRVWKSNRLEAQPQSELNVAREIQLLDRQDAKVSA